MLLSSRAAAMIRRTCSVGNTMAASRSNFLSIGLVRATTTLSFCLSALPSTESIMRLVEIVLRLEDVRLGRAVFPRGRAQIAERDLALAIVELRNLAELQGIAFAGTAGEIVEDAAARRHGGGIAAGLRKLELVDRTVGRKLVRRRQRRRLSQADTAGQRDRNRQNRRRHAEHRSTRHHHRNLPPRRPLRRNIGRSLPARNQTQPKAHLGPGSQAACTAPSDRRRQAPATV